MNRQNTLFLVSAVGMAVAAASGCLDLKTTNQETTGGQGGSAGSGQGGTGADSISSSSASSSSSGSNSSSSSSSSSASSSSSSGGGNCLPGDSMACYVGPLDTTNIGTCKNGQMTCNGGMWTNCTGSILPVLEACNSNQDTNCDGNVGCTGTAKKSTSLGTSEDDIITAIANGMGSNGFDGVVYGAGYRAAVAAADGTPNSAEVLFVKRDPDGTLTDWSNKFSIEATGHAYTTGVALSPQEDVVFAGVYQNGTLSIGGQALKTTGASKLGFLGSFTPTGTLQFMKAIGANGTTHISDVEVDGSGNIYICGKFTNSVDFGDGATIASDSFDGFVVSYTKTGAFRWKQIFTGIGDQSVDAVAIDAMGNLYVASKFITEIHDGAGTIFTSDGAADELVTALSLANGAIKWNTHIGGSGDLFIGSIAANAGKVALATPFRGTLTIGINSYTSMDAANLFDSIVATLDSTSGNVVETTPLVAIGTQVAQGIAIDSFGDVIINGYFTSKLPLTGIPDLNSGSVDVNAFVVKFDSTLAPRWAHGYGNSLIQGFTDVAIDAGNGHIFIGGGFQGILLQFGPNAPQSTGGFDALLGVMSN